jgi:hypothetical protein
LNRFAYFVQQGKSHINSSADRISSPDVNDNVNDNVIHIRPFLRNVAICNNSKTGSSYTDSNLNNTGINNNTDSTDNTGSTDNPDSNLNNADSTNIPTAI